MSGESPGDGWMHRFIARLKVELIVLFAYLVGIVILTGYFMDPESYYPDNPLWRVNGLIVTYVPDVYVRVTLGLLLLFALGLLFKKAFAIGGPGAIIGVAMGFLAGLATPTDILVGIVMLGIGLACGYISLTGLTTLKNLRLRKRRD